MKEIETDFDIAMTVLMKKQREIPPNMSSAYVGIRYFIRY